MVDHTTQDERQIALDAACLSFGSGENHVPALVDVDLVIPRGEFVAVTGASGSGKSTLLNVIAGLTPVDSGTVSVAGQRLSEQDADRRAAVRLRHVGVVFQDHNLIREFSALENVLVPLRARGQEGAAQEASRWLERVGLAGLEARRPHELSGGQQQRVGIARALAGQREILLADEPTGALDSANGHELVLLLEEINRAGTTVVLITHDPSVAAHAPRRLIMHDGRLSEACTYEPAVQAWG